MHDKPYGVRIKRFRGRAGELTTTEHFFSSEEKRERFLTKEEEKPNWYGVDAFLDPKVVEVANVR